MADPREAPITGGRSRRFMSQHGYALAFAAGSVTMLLGLLVALLDKESIAWVICGTVLLLFGAAAGTIQTLKVGREGAEFKFQLIADVFEESSRRAEQSAPMPMPGKGAAEAPPGLAQAARLSELLHEASSAIRSDTSAELSTHLTRLVTLSGSNIHYSYDEAEPGKAGNFTFISGPADEHEEVSSTNAARSQS